ncbi:hypothetical protein GCM10009682_07880 [Luedemannella flava]|uniref:DUF2867 domain-containing protein n=1 Tax=Luedemannella flava TaxID=349316 RepID=A0ABP4XMC5_9ACTN
MDVGHDIDEFSRTFLPLAAQAGIPTQMINRHLPELRQHVAGTDTVVLVAQCLRPEKPAAGPHLFLLTRTHLVVTGESRLRRSPRLHLRARVDDLEAVTWQADPAGASVDVAVTCADGRQRFWIRTVYPRQLWRFDAALEKVFRASADAARRRSLFAPRGTPRVART